MNHEILMDLGAIDCAIAYLEKAKRTAIYFIDSEMVYREQYVRDVQNADDMLKLILEEETE